jgi:hypothetical protein
MAKSSQSSPRSAKSGQGKSSASNSIRRAITNARSAVKKSGGLQLGGGGKGGVAEE